MKRLTKKCMPYDPFGWVGGVYLGESSPTALCPRTFCKNGTKCELNKDRSCPFLAALDRLAEYEDTGLMPSEIKQNSATNWTPCAEGLPESGKSVLLLCEVQPIGQPPRTYICVGYHADRFSIECGYSDETATEYDEETDESYLEEGFYEEIKNWDDFSSVTISDFVLAWQPLPEPWTGEEYGGEVDRDETTDL